MAKPRPTDAEFEELKRKRDESVEAAISAACKEHGWDRGEVQVHTSHSGGCYCDCPEGPCQHTWDGPDYEDQDEGLVSVTCSRCGAVAAYHDMRCAP